MATVSRTAYKSWVDQYVNTNNAQAITGAIMNQALNDLADSVLWGVNDEGDNIVVSSAGTTVSFGTPFGVADSFNIIVRCYDAGGDIVDYKIDPAQITETGFYILPAADGFIDYRAYKKGY